MRWNYVKTLFVMMTFGLILQSCTQDEGLKIESTEELRGGQGGPGGPGGGSGGANNTDVSRINNDIVYQWTNKMLSVEQYASGMRPNASARALAYMSLAAYETAVSGMRDNVSTTNRLEGLSIRNNERPRNINWEIALNACYADVVNHFMLNLPADRQDQIEAFEELKESQLSNNVQNKLREDSKRWGAYVAEQVIEYSQTDEAAEAQILEPQPISYEPPTGDGYWTYSADQERALFPYWEQVRTFVISTDETTTVPPIEYSTNQSSLYFAEMMEAYTDNNAAKSGDEEQLWIAEFWSDDVENLMISPPARQFSIANQLIKKYNLNLAETLTLYVKLGFSMNDAAVSTWKYKYDHMVMRPSNYIHEFIDPDYQTNLYRLIYWPNPSFPGYPSGHSCFASAAGGVFINSFGNQTNFIDKTHEGRTEFQGAPRGFSSFREMARENAFSRIPLGVHIRMDCAEGLRLGYEISDAINKFDLDRKPG